MNPDKCYEWLTVIFLHEAFDLQEQSDAILDELKGAGAGKDNIVYLILDSVSHPKNPMGQQVNIFQLSVQLLTFHADKQAWTFDPVDVPFNNADRSCWKVAFSYIYSRVKAKRRILISFSHGAAFGINADLGKVIRIDADGNPVVSPESLAKGITVTSNHFAYLDKKDIATIEQMPQWAPLSSTDKDLINKGEVPLDKNSRACKRVEMVWINDLADTLKSCLGKEKIDLLILNNCYMQCFDTGYLLREIVDYILAPEGSLDAIGYDYGTLMKKINKKPPEYDVLRLAKETVDDYVAFYKAQDNVFRLDQQAVYLVATKAYEEALALFTQFLDVLDEHLPTIIDDLIDIRENKILYVSCDIDEYTANYLDMIDAFQWVEMVMTRCADIFKDTDLATVLPRVKGEILQAGHKGDRLKQFDASARPKKFGYEGISIFFPLKTDFAALTVDNPTPWCLFFADQLPSAWESRWKAFLNKYFGMSQLVTPK